MATIGAVYSALLVPPGIARVVMLRAFPSTGALPVTVTGTLSLTRMSAMLVAVTTTVCVVDAIGAVKRPRFEILPALAVQVTAGLIVLVTVAVNWISWPGATVALAGRMST